MGIPVIKFLRLHIHNYLVLSFLIGMPLFVVGVLAVKTMSLEYEGLEIEREKAGLAFLLHIESEIRQVIEKGVSNRILQAELAIDDDPIEKPRKLVLVGDIGFIVIFQGEKRIFPPEDSKQILVSEKSMMSLLNGPLFTARQQMNNGEAYLGLVGVTSSSSARSILYCQKSKNIYDVCVLSKRNELNSNFLVVLQKYIESYPEWTLTLSNENKTLIGNYKMNLDEGIYYTHQLESPFQDWELRGRPMNSSTHASGWPLLSFIVISSLVLSWASLVLFFYRQQQARLKENKQRTELAAKLSHELHTPLANIALYIDLLKRRSNDTQAVLKYADIMQDETDRLSRVSYSAIAVAQGEDKNIHREPNSPDDVVKQLLNRFFVYFNNAKSEIIFNGSASNQVVFDSAALESIVLQLLDNACKYGDSDKILLTTKIVSSHLYITVRDYGSGIQDKEKELIFKTNYRGKNLEKNGFGLGLAAVRHLARLNKGDIYVEDAQPGAKFIVSLEVSYL